MPPSSSTPDFCPVNGCYWACKCAQEMDEKEWLEAVAQLEDVGLDIRAWSDEVNGRDQTKEIERT